MEIVIPEERLEVRVSRSGGPGGQNVNKVSSRVEIRFSLDGADWIPPAVRERLRELYPSRITRTGDFRLVSSRFRDQPRNLRDCIEKLGDLLSAASRRPAPRIPTRPGRGARERRLQEKRRISARKRERGARRAAAEE
jgi:ribosome-associated protein